MNAMQAAEELIDALDKYLKAEAMGITSFTTDPLENLLQAHYQYFGNRELLRQLGSYPDGEPRHDNT